MILTIDIGNTQTVFAVYGKDGGQRDIWRRRTDTRAGADEIGVWLWTLLDWAGLAPEAVIIGSVVPDATPGTVLACNRYLRIPAYVVGKDIKNYGIEIASETPEQLGADRIVNAVAMVEEGCCPGIVLDFGTATTFDVLDSQGFYQGGVIAPGIRLSLDALSQAAAQLPKLDIKPTEKVIGKNTQNAMESGIFWGYAGLIEGVVQRIADELGVKPEVIATGGLAPLFSAHMELISRSDPDLTLRGLYYLYKRNFNL